MNWPWVVLISSIWWGFIALMLGFNWLNGRADASP